MSISASDMMRLIDAGLTTEQLRLVAEVMAQNQASGIDEQAERRRAKDRERKRNPLRKSAESSAEIHLEKVSPLSSPPLPPTPPITPPIIPPSVDAGGETRDALGWPLVRSAWADQLMAETGCADPVKDIWPRTSAAVLVGWHETDKWEWQDVVAGIQSVMIRGPTSPPSTWKYFVRSIARANADRTTKTPETQANERRNQTFTTPAQRNEGSTIAAFGRVFGQSPDGEDEPIHAVG